MASSEELKNKIKEDAEKQFAQQADQKLMADVTDFLIEKQCGQDPIMACSPRSNLQTSPRPERGFPTSDLWSLTMEL